MPSPVQTRQGPSCGLWASSCPSRHPETAPPHRPETAPPALDSARQALPPWPVRAPPAPLPPGTLTLGLWASGGLVSLVALSLLHGLTEKPPQTGAPG